MTVESLKLNNGTYIPTLGLGTWNLTDSQCEQTVSWALEIGYRHIDTAKIYGNEAEIGRAIADSNLLREEVFITTKLWPQDFNHTEAAINDSLERLKTDYVDLYLIHWPSGADITAVWKILQRLYSSGHAKAIGVSNFDQSLINGLLETPVVPAVNQIEVNPLNYNAELIDYCRSNGIAITAYSPLAGGRLITDPLVTELAQAYERSAAQIILRWCLQHGLVTIPKTANRQRLVENFKIFDFKLAPGDIIKLDELSVYNG